MRPEAPYRWLSGTFWAGQLTAIAALIMYAPTNESAAIGSTIIGITALLHLLVDIQSSKRSVGNFDKYPEFSGLGTPKPKQSPATISELLDGKVRSGVDKQVLSNELNSEENAECNSSEGLTWLLINAEKRHKKAVWPRKEHEGD